MRGLFADLDETRAQHAGPGSRENAHGTEDGGGCGGEVARPAFFGN